MATVIRCYCGRRARMLVVVLAWHPVCGIHARPYRRDALARIAYYRPRQDEWS